MILFYIDESGNTGTRLNDPDQPVLWVVAIGVAPSALKAIKADMLAIAVQYFGNRAHERDFEFHGNAIFSGQGDFRILPPAMRVDLYAEVLQLIARRDCKVFITGLNKAEFAHEWHADGRPLPHPHRVAFLSLAMRIEEWLAEQQPPRDLFDTPVSALHGLLVADEQREIGGELVRDFAILRDRELRGAGSGRELRFLLDTIHYVPSHHSRAIQLADCVAYLLSRYARVQRKRLGGQTPTQSDERVVELWEEHCRDHVVSREMIP